MKIGKTTALIALAVLLIGGAPAQDRPFLRVSVIDGAGVYRVELESSFPISSILEKSGAYLVVKIRSDQSILLQRRAFESDFIESVNWERGRGFYSLQIEAAGEDFVYDTVAAEGSNRLEIRFFPGRAFSPQEGRPERTRAGTDDRRGDSGSSGPPLADGAEAQRRIPQRRIIVLDPGHGGILNGATGREGTLEKDVTLAISLKLKSIIERDLALNVELTRDKDVDVSLESRAALANNLKAFLFISIHANSSYRKNARGSETYFLSLNATDEEAARLAYLENNSQELNSRISGADQDQIKMILWDMAQTAYLKQSSRFAELIQEELNTLLDTRNRGIKQAPFSVLSGVACPAVLVEVAFISNPDEEKELNSEPFQEKVAQAIYRGLIRFIRESS